MHEKRVPTGFTVIELLVALTVTGLILSAVATLAFAMSSATRASESAAFAQTEVRTATLRLVDLIRNCRMICAAPGDDIAIWRADENNDGLINPNELVYIERGTTHSYLQLGQFSHAADPNVPLSSLSLPGTKEDLAKSYTKNDVVLLHSASNVQFCPPDFDEPCPPTTRGLVISFDLTQDLVTHHYEIDLTMLGSAINLIDTASGNLTRDDD